MIAKALRTPEKTIEINAVIASATKELGLDARGAELCFPNRRPNTGPNLSSDNFSKLVNYLKVSQGMGDKAAFSLVRYGVESVKRHALYRFNGLLLTSGDVKLLPIEHQPQHLHIRK